MAASYVLQVKLTVMINNSSWNIKRFILSGFSSIEVIWYCENILQTFDQTLLQEKYVNVQGVLKLLIPKSMWNFFVGITDPG